jgi:hypothetical protein
VPVVRDWRLRLRHGSDRLLRQYGRTVEPTAVDQHPHESRAVVRRRRPELKPAGLVRLLVCRVAFCQSVDGTAIQTAMTHTARVMRRRRRIVEKLEAAVRE